MKFTIDKLKDLIAEMQSEINKEKSMKHDMASGEMFSANHIDNLQRQIKEVQKAIEILLK